jgi:hypothetical protein
MQRRSLAPFTLLALLSTACVTEPGASAVLVHAHPMERVSDRGLVQATLEVSGAGVTTGENDFVLTLTASSSSEDPSLDDVVATMPAHTHRAEPSVVERAAGSYRIVALPFAMSGLWELRCDVEVGGATDSLVFDIDVP